MIRWLLRKFNFYNIDYGFSCGKHWIEFDGKIICQTQGGDFWMQDEDIACLGYYLLDHGEYWERPRYSNIIQIHGEIK